MFDNFFEELGLQSKGIEDYDDLTDVEQETYRKMIEIQESSQITLEDVKKHIATMRQSVELEVARMPKDDPKFDMYRARQYVYILMESVFTRPDRAKDMLKQMTQRIKL